MARSEAKAKTVRRALRDVSNNNGGGRFSRSMTSTATKKFVEKEHKPRVDDDEEGEQQEVDALDRLRLAQSDLSALLHQIDELVVQAFKFKSTSRQGRKEVDSFAHVLSDMLSSLKPWVPRFQKVLSSGSLESMNQSRSSLVSQTVSAVNEVENEVPKSPDKTNTNMLISPSPLVSWRANCTIERGRQLFLLTPLPISKSLSSTHLDPPKSLIETFTSDAAKNTPCFNPIPVDTNNCLLEDLEVKPTPGKPSDLVATTITSSAQEGENVSPPMFSKSNRSIVVMTPCLKRSPPKSCVLLEAISESSHAGHAGARRSTPFPVGLKNYTCSNTSDSSSGSEASEGLALKYPELLGIQHAYKSGVTKKIIEVSPDWFRSPPKTCVLLEPSDERTLDNAAAAENCCFSLPVTGHVLNNQMNVSVLNVIDSQDCGQQAKTTHLKEPLDGNFTLVESTPIWKESQSTIIKRGKHPGENTLKKELWTKFEAASINGLRFNTSVLQETSNKGFLDRLDEASCDGET